MISFERFVLHNGLTLIVHEDASTPMATVNVLYKVGARDESPDKTGFAHLFEHLMFGGSINIPNFDTPLETAGGENNAFTNNDITNYYINLPASNLDTALWLESDRMMSLDFRQEPLDTQKSVVIEEFKEHYINQPYGDLWHKLSDLSYKVHPYRWPTIGLIPEHIEQAKLQDVKEFFFKYYRPNNAVMVIAGGVKTAEVLKKVQYWFGDIPAGPSIERNIPKEPAQNAARIMEVSSDVPVNCLFKSFHMSKRADKAFHASDLLTDILGGGDSARLHQRLVKDNPLFSSINAYVSGTLDEGLFIIDSKLNEEVSFEKAEAALNTELAQLMNESLGERELQKVKNQVEAHNEYNDISVLNRAMNLAFYECMGDVDYINREVQDYLEVTAPEIQDMAATLFKKENSNTLYYKSEPLS